MLFRSTSSLTNFDIIYSSRGARAESPSSPTIPVSYATCLNAAPLPLKPSSCPQATHLWTTTTPSRSTQRESLLPESFVAVLPVSTHTCPSMPYEPAWQCGL
ncbi:hypothetical protein EJ02DRAFT_182511 [Clathrospora elynae]|uniref:Uncharacterized protein n=1 Tax=Clathrospora elynae TaxID=706981 RepID=A0A6A5SQS7_9PLEO|nr:hypothetical protein EJ02DRAFT_182511 [Clathrospora elynae]